MEIFNLVFFGFVVYAALILVPGLWDEYAATHR